MPAILFPLEKKYQPLILGTGKNFLKRLKDGRIFHDLPFFSFFWANLNYALVAVGDFNGDTKPDILWRNTSTGANALRYLDGVMLSDISDLPALPNPDYSIVGR